MFKEIMYKIKTKLGLRVHWVDHLIYLQPEDLSPLGRKLQTVLDDQIFNLFKV